MKSLGESIKDLLKMPPLNGLPENDQMYVAGLIGGMVQTYTTLPALEAVGLLRELTDRDPCRYDHHGYCQAHSLHERPCPHERAKRLLAFAAPPA